MKKIYFFIFFLVCVNLLGLNSAFAQVPVISSFTPATGPIGTSVTINGSNFNATSNTVYFGATKANVTATSATQLTVTVPVGATYQPISVTSGVLTGYSLTPFITTFTSKNSLYSSDFDTPTTAANTLVNAGTGLVPRMVVSGDFDGDGLPDLAVLNKAGTGSILIYLNNSATPGNYTTAPYVIATPSAPTYIAVGDLDGDGKLDLVVANTAASISVFLNKSTGAGVALFSAYTSINTSSTPNAVNIADIDGDGKPDIISSGSTNGNVSILRNTITTQGITSFAAAFNYAAGTGAYFTAVGDMDGDGKPDLVITNNIVNPNTLIILQNKAVAGAALAAGSFAAPVTFPQTSTATTTTNTIALADMDGDGKLDVVLSQSGIASITIFRNTSAAAGSFTFDAKVDFATGASPFNLAVADLDGDGKPDVVVNDYNGAALSIFRNTFTSGSISTSSLKLRSDLATVTVNPTVPIIADLDGDGKPDILTGANSGTNFYIYKNDPYQPPTIASISPVTGAAGSSVTITGANFGSIAGNNVVMFGGTKAAITLASATQLVVTVPRGIGYQPLTVINTSVASRPLTVISTQLFSTTFASKNSITDRDISAKFDLATTSGPGQIVFGDLDGDGLPDMVSANKDKTISVYLHNTTYSGYTSAYPTTPSYKITLTVAINYIALGDLDGDGKADIAVAEGGVTQSAVLLSTATGAGSSGWAPTITLTSVNVPQTIAIADIDGDGKLDIAASMGAINTVSMYRNNSFGTTVSFSGNIVVPVGFAVAGLAVGDIDGDGKPDLVMSNRNATTGQIAILRNICTPGFISATSGFSFVLPTAGANSVFATLNTPYQVTLADVDGDGKLDIAIADNTSAAVSVFRNNSTAGSFAFDTRVDFTTPSTPYAVAFADVDGDGKPDMVTANGNGTPTVSIFKNTTTNGATLATTSFGTKVDYPIGVAITSSIFLALNDIDGDGKPDIITPNPNGLAISILHNAPSYAPVITSFSPLTGQAGNTLTINGSNFATTTTNNIVYFGSVTAVVNAASATQLTVTVPVGASYGPISVENNTDKPAIGYSTASFNPVFTSKNSITTADFDALSNITASSKSVFIVDMDGDGRPDIVTAGGNSSYTIHQKTTSTGNLINTNFDTPVARGAGNSNITMGAMGDIDGDGKPDMVVIGNGGSTTAVGSMYPLKNNSTSGVPSLASGGTIAVGINPSSIILSDLDGDGRLDAIVSNLGSGTISVFRNTTTVTGTVNTNSFTLVNTITVGTNPTSVSAGDLDGDGKPDLVVTNGGSGNISVLHNSSTLNTIAFDATIQTFATGANPQIATIGDLDGDGKLDIIVPNNTASTISIFRNTSTVGAIDMDIATAPFATGTGPIVVTLGDIDGDGKADVLVGNGTAKTLSILRNTSTAVGTITLAAKVDITCPNTLAAIAVSDLDADGKADIVSGNTNTISLIRNDPSTSVPTVTTTTGNTTFASVTGTQTPVAIDNGLTVTEINKTTLASATATITTGLVIAQDILAFTNDGATMGNITASAYDSASGLLTLTSSGASATLAQFQSALRSVTYSNSSTTPNVANRVISFAANDGAITGLPATKIIVITSSNAQLSAITVNAGTLDPAFTTGVNSYTLNVANNVSSITLTPFASVSNSVLKINNTVVANGTASTAIPLTVGANTITIAITASDGTTTGTYTITATRAPSANAALSNLALSSGTLSPVFSGPVQAYTAQVPNSVSSITVTPAVAEPNATVTVNNVAVVSGSASAAVNLTVGDNIITTTVTAQDGTTTGTYTVTINRAPSVNANLAGISISNGTLSPVFAATTNSYTASVANNIASITLTPATADGTATISVNGITVVSGSASASLNLNVGINNISVAVTAQDGSTTNTYTVSATRAASANANLANITLSNGTLSPAFTAGTNIYGAAVANNITSVTLTPVTADATAAVTVNGNAVNSGGASAAIALSVGANTITAVVTAQDGITTTSYSVTVTRAQSANADLSNIALSSGTLSPAFLSGTNNYTATVFNTTTTITLTPTLAEANATVTVNGATVASGSASGNIALSIGTNIVTTLVTAQNGTTQKTYTVTITRAGSPNADLADLDINSGTLTPIFNPATITYATGVTNAITSVTITATVAEPNATVKVNGTTVASGTGTAISVSNGANTIAVVVTAQDGSVKTYTLTVTKSSSSNNADLSALALSNGTLSPAFAAGTNTYTASVGNAVTSIRLTPNVAESHATLTVNGIAITSGSASDPILLAVGANEINTLITAQDGITKNTYTVTMTRAASSNANLSNLASSNGTLSPVFSSGSNSYTVLVGNGISSITVTPTLADATASVAVNGNTVASGNASGAISLTVGQNTITTTVTAQNGTINTYTVTVTRAQSSNANLAEFVLSDGTLSPAFSSAVNSYSASVANTTTSVTLTPTLADATATVKVNGTPVTSGNISGAISLTVGANTITTIVTAQDGTVNTYNLTVSRALSSNASLASLGISSGTLSPAFNAVTNNYTTSVNNAITSISVTPAVSDVTASVKVNGTPVTSGSTSGAINLSVGSNTITTTVTAQNGTVNTYTVVVTRAQSSNNNLSNLIISSGTLSPVFASGTNSYNATTSGTSITVTPTLADATATVKVNNTPINSGSASGALALAIGDNTISISVTAQNGAVNTYSLTVTRLGTPQTITFPALAGVSYGSADVTPAATSTNSTIPITYSSSNLSVATITTSGTIRIAGAGTANITASQNGNSTYSAATPIVQSITVNPVVLTVTANNQTKLYGSANPALSVSYSGFVNGDDATKLTTLPSPGTTVTATSNVGSYPVTASGAASANYTFTYTAGTLTVTPAALTITADDKTKIYGVANPAFSLTYTGFVNSDNATKLTTQATVTSTATAASQVSTYSITASGAASANYNISYTAGTLSVTPAPLIITANNQTKAYGAAIPTLTASYSGFVNGDDATRLITLPNVTTTATAASPSNTYPITASGAASANYAVTYAAGVLTVGKATLNITANNQTKNYGDANPALTVTYNGFVNGDDATKLTTLPTLGTTATATSNVGSYPVTASGAAAANYTVTYTAGSLTVAKAPLTITANNIIKVYGAVNPALTLTYTGFVNGDNATKLTTQATVTTTALTTSPVGTYPITPASAAAANYAITFVPGTLTVTPAALTVSTTTVSRAYGAVNPTFTINYTGFITGESKTNLLTQATAVTTAVATSPVGAYPVTTSGAISNNYNITYTIGTLNVTPAVLTITPANVTTTYGAVNPTLTANYTGFVNGDTPASLTTAPTLATTATATSNAGTYPITASGAAIPNYTINYVAGTLTVNKAVLTITANNQNKLFGAVNPPLTVSYSGFVNGDDATKLTKLPTVTTTATTTSNSGNYAITASAATAANYNFTYVAGVLTVGIVTRTLTFNPLPNKTYGDADFDAGATVDSGDPVIYTTSDNSVATIVNGQVHIVGGGTVTITASVATRANYSAVTPITQQLTIDRASQVITFNPIAVQQKGGGTINVNATSSSGLTVFLSSSDPLVANVNTLTQGVNLLRIGNTVITASQPGDNNYLPAVSVAQLLRVDNADQDNVLVPGGVSPNNDGVNDFLIIEGIKDFPDNKLTIVDRNGVKLFEKSNYDNSANVFDGHSTVNGSMMTQGTYFYVLQYTANGQSKRKAGYLIIKY